MIVLLFITFCAGVLADIQSQCNRTTFETCQKTFSDQLKIDQSYNWHNPTGLGIQIQNIYIQGVNGSTEKGIVSVCSAYNDFLDCLSAKSFTAAECFDPVFLISADSTPVVAYQYAFLMSMQQYQCGSGFYPAVENWDCLQNVYNTRNKTIQECIRTFQINEISDSGLDACKHVQTGMDCFRNAARSCSSTLQYYACESFRQYAQPLYQTCNEQCHV